MRIILSLFLTVALLSSCSKKSTPEGDGDCTKYAIVPVSRIEHEADSINVYFHVFSGCGQFNKFIEKDSANIHLVSVQAVYKGCICTMDIPERMAKFRYRPKPGIQFLQFNSEDGEKLTEQFEVK